MRKIAKSASGPRIEPGPPIPAPPDPDPQPLPPHPAPEPDPPERDRASVLLRLAELPRTARDRAFAGSRRGATVRGGIVRF